MVFHPSGESIYVSGNDATLWEYNLERGKVLHMASMPAQGDRLRLLNDRYLAIVRRLDAGHIPVLDTNHWERDPKLLYVGANPADIIALPDGKTTMMPPGLEKNAFPKDFWIQPARGEFLLGLFRDAQKREALFVANHNTYAEQTVTLKLGRPAKVSLFDREEGTWRPLSVTDGTVTFKLEPAGGELLRVEK